MNNNSENIKEWDKPLFETSFKETGNWHAKESREKVGEIIYTLYEGLQNVYESIGGFYDEEVYQKALEIEFKLTDMFDVKPQYKVPVIYEGEQISNQYFDFVVIPNKKKFDLKPNEIPAFILEIKKQKYSNISEETDDSLGRRRTRQQLWRYLDLCQKSNNKSLNQIKWGVLANFSKKLETYDMAPTMAIHNTDDGVDLELWYRDAKSMDLYIYSEKEKVQIDNKKAFKQYLQGLETGQRTTGFSEEDKEAMFQNTSDEVQFNFTTLSLVKFIDKLGEKEPLIYDIHVKDRTIIIPYGIENYKEILETRAEELKIDKNDKRLVALLFVIKETEKYFENKD
jgi:hypothetical protein